MTTLRLIPIAVVIYLLWQGVEAIRDLLNGRVFVRNWLLPHPFWWLHGETLFKSSIALRRDEPSKFWAWTLWQAFWIIGLIVLFFAIAVDP